MFSTVPLALFTTISLFFIFLNISGARCLLIENVNSAYTDFTIRLNVVFLKQMNKNSNDDDDDVDHNDNTKKTATSTLSQQNIIQNNPMNHNNSIANIDPFLPIQSRKCDSRGIRVQCGFGVK